MNRRVVRIEPLGHGAAQSRAVHAQRFLAPGQIKLASLPPLSLYVHFPWCVRKCPYCDFNSHEAPAVGIPEDEYLAALRLDLENALPLVWGRCVQTVFIGGGTPSLMSARGVDQLLADIRALLPVEPDAEITLEANPGTFEAAKFRDFKACGINRLSLGVQSFDDRRLRTLGRIHGGKEALRALDVVASTFDNFNIDLMYALPGQDVAACIDDLKRATAFAPTHLSVYHLTIEPNTVFAKFPPALPDDEQAADMLEAAAQVICDAGYGQYEVSAYARPGWQARHNRNYWEFGDYLGIGAGAHGKLSFPERIIRQARVKAPMAYIERCKTGDAIVEEREVLPHELGFEFMLNALRLRDGVPSRFFELRTGVGLDSIADPLNEAVRRGLLDPDPTVLRATEIGWHFLNDLQQIFLVDA